MEGLQSILKLPLFGILVTLVAYALGQGLQRRFKNPLVNPILIAIATLITLLTLLGIPYTTYNEGGKWISFFLTPATVALAVPLYRHIDLLKKNAPAIGLGVLSGCIANASALLILGSVLKLDRNLTLSLLPKSVTTPIGLELSAQIGGIPQLTVALIVFTGIVGVVLGPSLFKLLKITNPLAQGIAYGTASHALGTSKALEVGPVEGGMSGLSIGISGLITAILLPLILKFF